MGRTVGYSESKEFENDPLLFWKRKMEGIGESSRDMSVLKKKPVLRYNDSCYVDQSLWPPPDIVFTFDCYLSESLESHLVGMQMNHVSDIVVQMGCSCYSRTCSYCLFIYDEPRSCPSTMHTSDTIRMIHPSSSEF